MAAAVALAASTFSGCNTSCRVLARTFDPYRCDRFAGVLRTQSPVGDWNVGATALKLISTVTPLSRRDLTAVQVIVLSRARAPRDSRLGSDGGSDARADEADADTLGEQRIATDNVSRRHASTAARNQMRSRRPAVTNLLKRSAAWLPPRREHEKSERISCGPRRVDLVCDVGGDFRSARRAS